MYSGKQHVLMEHMKYLSRTKLIVDSTHLTYLRHPRLVQFILCFKKVIRTII